MKRSLLVFTILVLAGLTACQAAASQPVFTPGTEVTITPMTYAPQSAKIAATLPGVITFFDISPDLKTIAFATSQGVDLYDFNSYTYLRTLSKGIMVTALDWSPDGKYLAVGLVVPNTDQGIAHLDIWDTAAWQKTTTTFEKNDSSGAKFWYLAWSPDGTKLAASGSDLNDVLVWDVHSGKIVSTQTEFSSSVRQFAWSPDSSRLVATSDLAYGIRRWVVSSDISVRLFDQHAGSSMDIAWSPDGKRIASGHSDGQVCIWTVATNKCDGFIQAHRSAVFSLAWSPDSTKLATGAGVIRIWDMQTGKLVSAFGEYDNARYGEIQWPALDAPLVTLQTSLDDESITVVRFWDMTSGTILVEFKGGTN